MKKKMRRMSAMLLAFALVLQQGNVLGTYADETEPVTETATTVAAGTDTTEPTEQPTEVAPTTELTETETKALEPIVSNTQDTENKAPLEETKPTESEPSVTESEPGTPETTEANTNTEVSESTTEKSSESESAAESETETEKVTEAVTETETETVTESETETAAESETELATETVTETVTEAVTETEGETQLVTESETEAVTEKETETESETETETEAKAELAAEVTQEVFQKTTEDAVVPMVKYTVKLTNKTAQTDAKQVALKVVLDGTLSYMKEEGETAELVSFDTLGAALAGNAFEANEPNDEQKAAYADGSVVLWKDQTIAGGTEKTFVFFAEVKDGETDVNALRSLWLVDGEAVRDEQIKWVNAEQLEVKKELPSEFIFDNGNMVVTATLSDPESLPEGAELIVKDAKLGTEDKNLIEETLGEENILTGYVAYDMHFEADGQIVQPDKGEVGISVTYKKAKEPVSTIEKLEKKNETLAKTIEKAEKEYAIYQLPDDKSEAVEVTEDVNVDKKDRIRAMSFSSETLGLIVAGENAQNIIEWTDDSFGADPGYSIENLLNGGYNVISYGDAVISQHTVGGILVGGNLSSAGGTVDQDNRAAAGRKYLRPSYVKGLVNSDWHYGGGKNKSEGIPPAYIGSGNVVTYENWGIKLNGHSYGSAIDLYMTDTYFDFDTAWAVLKSAGSYLSGQSEGKVEQENGVLKLRQGKNVTVSMSGVSEVRLDGTIDSGLNTVVNILDSGEVVLPCLWIGEKSADGTTEEGAGCSIVWNIPNATSVIVGAGSRGWVGHIIAPNAAVVKDGAQYAGTLIGKTVSTSGEGHCWPYGGDKLVEKDSCTFSLEAHKTMAAQGTELGSYRFEVLDDSGKVIETAQNDNTGAIHFKNVVTFTEEDVGKTFTYKVKEKKPQTPDGTIYDETEYTVTVDVLKEGETLFAKVTSITKNGATVDEMQFVNDVTYLSILKVDESGAPLAGAKLELKDAAGKVVDSWTTDGKAHDITGITPGNYTLSEVEAPQGYQVSADIPVTVTEAHTTAAPLVVTMVDKRLNAVSILKVDESGAPLAGAKLVLKDAAGNAVDSWTTDGKAHDITGIVPGNYTLSEVEAPQGYQVSADIPVTVTEAHTTAAPLTVTMVDKKLASVSILKVDESNAPLAGAKLVLKDAAGNMVDAWTTDGKAHDITGVAFGNYTLSEIEAPQGYQVSADIPVSVTDANSAAPLAVTMTDKKIPASDNRSLTVTKHLRLDGITSDLGVRDATYYVALFSDEAKTQRVSNVKKIEFKNQTSSSATFDNLASNTTYYVGETDENGNLLVSKKVNDRVIFYPEYNDSAVVTFEGRKLSATSEFTNVYVELEPGFYLAGQLTITKKVLIGGEEGFTDDTFYARVFSNAALTKPASDVLTLAMNGNSTTSVTVTDLPIGETLDSSAKYFVAETDENGTPLNPDEITEYEISIDNSKVVLSANNSEQEVVITNDFVEEEESEVETEVDEKKTAPKTGDDTDFMRYLLLMAFSFGLFAVAVGQKRSKKREEE